MKCNERYLEPSSIVLLQIPDRDQLEKELEKFQSIGIDCAPFYEPYDNTGLTAFSTLPLGEEHRHLFKDYTLWGRSVKGIKTPLSEFLKAENKEEQRKKKLKETHQAIDLVKSNLKTNLLMEKV